jgi:choline dehydrogenase-like flavoprotein
MAPDTPVDVIIIGTGAGGGTLAHRFAPSGKRILLLERGDTRFQKTLSLIDLYFGADNFEFPLGNIQMIGKSQGPMFKGDAPRFAPGGRSRRWPSTRSTAGSRPRTSRTRTTG